MIPFKGEAHLVLRSGGARSLTRRMDGAPGRILVGGEAAHFHRRLTDFLKREARHALTARVENYCARLERRCKSIRVGDTKTRWGSCSSDGALAFSWRLIMAPPEILDYVAAHECVHLIHMNHSPAFWRKVASLGVDARQAESWFRAHGAELFSYAGANH